MSKTSTDVKRRWNEKNYDRIYLTVPKGFKEQIKQRAEQENKSLNQFIIDCIESHKGSAKKSL